MKRKQLRKLANKLHDSKHVGCPGGKCRFVPITDKIGLKMYHDSKTRDIGFEEQSEACKYGLAPKTYGKYKNLGYFTEIVPICYNSMGAWVWSENNRDIVQAFRNKYTRKTGRNYFDYHGANFGWKNNKLVAIDFT